MLVKPENKRPLTNHLNCFLGLRSKAKGEKTCLCILAEDIGEQKEGFDSLLSSAIVRLVHGFGFLFNQGHFIQNGLGEAVSAVSSPFICGWNAAHPNFTAGIKPSSSFWRTNSFRERQSVLPLEPFSSAKVISLLSLLEKSSNYNKKLLGFSPRINFSP